MTRTVRHTPKIDRDATLNVDKLTTADRELLVGILQRFTTGGGPFPEETNLKFWRTHYALACIKKAFKHIRREHRAALRTLEQHVIASTR